MTSLDSFIESVSISTDVFELRPDVAVLIVAIDNVRGGPSDDESAAWLDEACQFAEENDHQPHVEAWQNAFRAFGAKPQKFKSSFDALLRRVSSGLPQINRVVDAYNAVSVKFGLPVGGENVDGYQGPLQLARADGSEVFDTIVNGEPSTEVVDQGEVVWRDDKGVTCRRWNWRQGIRTRVHSATDRVFFVYERLEPFPIERLYAASAEVSERIATTKSTIVTRLIQKP